MPRCYPPSPDFGDGRHGERAVWEALVAALPDEVALFYSVWIVENGRELEVDILVAWPGVGLAAVEVKGGQVERDATGQWWMVQQGNRRPAGHPLVQASDARHALQRRLQREGAVTTSVRTQHVLAFPHMAWPVGYDPADLPRTQVLDRDDLRDPAGAVRRAIESGSGHAPLTETERDVLVAVLTAPLVGQTSLITDAEEHRQRVDQLTRDQAKTLDSFRFHHRLAVIGGAGTGKTWLALEQARRLSSEGKRVALVCYSRGLGRFLQRVSHTWPRPPAYVGLFHDLAIGWGAPPPVGTESDYYEQELPKALADLAAARPEAELFDAVVVDEAQDFGEQWWISLLACLKDPAGGGVFVFMDEAQRVFARQSKPPIEIPPYLLTTNIRNTKQIAQVFGSLSSDELRFSRLDGPPVRFVQCREDEARDRADDAVDELLDVWQPGQVALITTRHKHPLQSEVVDGRGWQDYWDGFFAGEDVFYGHVLGFKGLEREVVILAVDGFKQPERAREMLYVGLSRASRQLVVCGDLERIAEVGGEGVRRRLLAAASR